MNAIPIGNYRTASRKSAAYLPAPVRWVEKSQTLSGEFGNEYYPLIRESLTPKFERLMPANGHASKEVGTVSPQFKDIQAPAFLSTASIEFSQSKIQTLSGKFRKRCLRNRGGGI